jgi:hypothetical protein
VAEWRSQFPTDWRAAAELLARRFPARWARQQPRYELTGSQGGPVQLAPIPGDLADLAEKREHDGDLIDP